MKVTFIILTFAFASCNSQTVKKNALQNGIWIPTKIDWNDGNFKTVYVYNDSSFILINSTQKLIKDSIYFEAEPGYSLYKCVTRKISNKVFASSEKVYSFISSPIKENTIDTLEIEFTQENYLVINGQVFQQTNKYNSLSVQTIKGLVNNFPKD